MKNPDLPDPQPALTPSRRPLPTRLPRHSLFATLVAAAIAVAGCNPRSSSSTTGAPTPRSYAVTGVVQRIQPDGLTAVIDHEMIPGYMMAMTMPFQAKDPQLLAGIYPGDTVTFRLLVTTNDAWIDKVRRTGQTLRPPPQDDTALNLVEELDAGDRLPDCTLTNDQGQTFQLSDFQGQALALTFIFTRCPLPTYCPLMSRNFALTSQELLQSNSPTNWHLLTLSFDPDFDSPQVLDFYARQYRTDPERWTFASGDRDAIEQLGRQLGLLLFREEATISHNLRTVVVDPNGHIHHVFRDNHWQAAELVDHLRAAAQTPPVSEDPDLASCRFTITGMSCDACALTIQSALQNHRGVHAAAVDFTNQTARVTYDPNHASPESLIQLINDLTYGATLLPP